MSISVGQGFKHKINGKYGNIIEHLDANATWQRVQYTDGTIDEVKAEDLTEYPVDMNGRHIFLNDMVIFYQKNGFPNHIRQGVVTKINYKDQGYNRGWKISVAPNDKGNAWGKGGLYPNELVVIDHPVIKKRG